MNERLKFYQEEFNRTNELSEPHRTRVLSNIMTDMEHEFKIPMLNNEVFNAANPEIITLYKEISLARSL